MGSSPSQYEVPEERESSGLVLREAVDENEANEQRLKLYREKQMKEILKAGPAGKSGLVLRDARQEDDGEEEVYEGVEADYDEDENEVHVGKKLQNRKHKDKYERLKQKLQKPCNGEEEEYEELADEEDEEAVLGEVETQMGKEKEERLKQKQRKAQEKAEDELMDKIREQYWKTEMDDEEKGKEKAQERKEMRTEKELRKEQERLKTLRLKQRQEDIATRKAMHRRTKTFPQGACQTTIDNRL